MKFFNIFYLLLVALGVSLYFLLSEYKPEVLSFYGFAESNETEINYNYPIVVDKIMVTQGQAVKAGDLLFKLSRVKAKETMADQNYRIAELQSESQLWIQKKQDAIKQEQAAKASELAEISERIMALEEELAFKKSLVQDLVSIDSKSVDYSPIETKISQLRQEAQSVTARYDLILSALQNELSIGQNPVQKQVQRLQAEIAFDASQKVQEILVKAPTDGLVGNIFCKEAEHVPSYRTLMSFYEPHSGMIKGYVHEDLTLKVDIGSRFLVKSIKDETITYDGQVVGLGSRIVEIPTRLRKMADFKTYGREVLVAIPKDNSFLQKEKVALSYVGD